MYLQDDLLRVTANYFRIHTLVRCNSGRIAAKPKAQSRGSGMAKALHNEMPSEPRLADT